MLGCWVETFFLFSVLDTPSFPPPPSVHQYPVRRILFELFMLSGMSGKKKKQHIGCNLYRASSHKYV